MKLVLNIKMYYFVHFQQIFGNFEGLLPLEIDKKIMKIDHFSEVSSQGNIRNFAIILSERSF